MNGLEDRRLDISDATRQPGKLALQQTKLDEGKLRIWVQKCHFLHTQHASGESEPISFDVETVMRNLEKMPSDSYE